MIAQLFQIPQQYQAFALSVAVGKDIGSLKMFLKKQETVKKKARKIATGKTKTRNPHTNCRLMGYYWNWVPMSTNTI